MIARLLAEQPPPTGDGPSITDAAAARCWSPTVRALLLARREQGIERYGAELGAHNGRVVVADLVQELVDARVYAEQWRIEGGPRWVAWAVEVVLVAVLCGVRR